MTEKFSLKEIAEAVVSKKASCGSCGQLFGAAEIASYDNPEGGIPVVGFTIPQWVYMDCTCGIATSINKIFG